MAIENLKAGANQSVKAGSVIISQGSPGNSLIILHEGSVSLRLAPTHSQIQDIGSSFYAISLKGPAIFGASAIIAGGTNFYHAITETPSVVSVYPANKDSLLKIIQSKPQIAILTLKTMLKEINDLKAKFSAVYSLIKYVVNIHSSLSFAFSKIQPEQFTEEKLKNSEETDHDQTLSSARVAVAKFLRKGQSIPENIDINFLKKDYASVIGMDFENTLSISQEDLDYYEKFVTLDPGILGAISQKSPSFIEITGQKISAEFAKITADICDGYQQCIKICDLILLGQYSWLEKYALQTEICLKNEISSPVLNNTSHFLLDSIRTLQDQVQKIWAQNRYEINQVILNKINQYLTYNRQEQINESSPVQSTISVEFDATASSAMKDSMNKILEFSELEPEKLKEFKALMAKFKEFSNPMESEGDAKKVKRAITTLYWLIYEKSIIRHFSKKEPLPKNIELFLLTGVVDETLLQPEQLNYIVNNVKRETSKYPIHHAIDWLDLIYQKKIPTSINELGVTFFEILKQENRDSGWKRETDLPANVNTPEARVRFEIHSMIAPTVKLTSGSIINHFPILTKYHITQSIERTFIQKSRLEAEIDKLLSIDFGAYHREILYLNEKMGITKEFIQLQVIPNMILVPSIGANFQYWQEREGNNRVSPGRLCAPIFALDDLFDMLLHATGAYRWELTKTLLGPDWNNITTSSLTADYTDYVQFYKKNRELSPDVKEKLAMEFKRFRDDRARFINDYMIWLKYESEGTQRLNKVVRKIMAKHIPFTKGIRENLLKLPNFQEIIQKSINIKKRKAIELEPRYKKYRAENNGLLPSELENTVKFYLMDY